MKRLIRSIVFLFVLMVGTSAVASSKKDFTQYVDPMIGTAFTGHTFPGAVYPFGMIQLSPDTKLSGWEVCSGYHYDEPYIYGFSHTHLNGTGCADLCDVLFQPVANYGQQGIEGDTYRSEYDHSNEYATPGYYRVSLDRWHTTAELTTGQRAAMHHYLYPAKIQGKNLDAEIIVDLTHRDALIDGEFKVVDDHTVCGYRRSRSWAADHSVYFWAEFSEPITDSRIEESTFTTPKGEKRTRPVKALLRFGKKSDVYVRIAISSVSEENARLNLRSELAPSKQFKKQFKQMTVSTKAAWNGFLGKIEVEAADHVRTTDGTLYKADEQLTSFYTALYHTAIAPCLFSDVNGQYRGMDGEVHTSQGHDQYTVFSLWDTYRSLHPLFTLIEQERTRDFLYSFLCIYRECGKLPIWELHRNETDCMIGYHSISVIADAWMKGLTLTDSEMNELFEAMLESTRKAEYGIDVFHQEGFVNPDKEHESISKTLEYCYDDWCIATVADKLGRKDIAAKYYQSALYYRNILDPETGFMRPKLRGIWLSPFNPTEVNNHFTEANSWQYSFHVQHNIQDHIALLGGDKAYGDKLDALFSASAQTTGRTQADITGLIGQYAHGNEPSHHDAYLFDAVGRPWRTAEVVYKVTDLFYQPVADGLCGNDDCGQMSAWYIFSTLGFYPVCPGRAQYAVGSPHFKQAKLHLEDGRTTTLRANIADGIYVQQLSTPAGGSTQRSFIQHDELLGGGTIRFTLGAQPSATYGTAPADRYITSSPSQYAVPTSPWFEATSTIIKNEPATVAIGKADASYQLRYRIRSVFDATDTVAYHPYDGTFTIDRRCLVDACAVDAQGRQSFPVTTRFDRIDDTCTITIREQCNRQYNAGGPEGLIDGYRGSKSWRTGGWQGYQGTDMHAIVDLGSEQELHRFGAGFLQDAGSWIWMPREVEFLISIDGQHYESLGTATSGVDPTDMTTQTMDIMAPALRDDALPDTYHRKPTATKARYLQVVARNLGAIPDWHPGAGEPTFFFIDEIIWE